jgi:heme oxygenase-like protein
VLLEVPCGSHAFPPRKTFDGRGHVSCLAAVMSTPEKSTLDERKVRDCVEHSLNMHRRLCAWNRERLSPALPNTDWLSRLDADAALLALEGRFVERERRDVRERAASVPRDADGFVAWFEALKDDGPGQNDPLFPWLADSAHLEEMRWFLQQEVAGEAGFEDLVALSQVKLPKAAKLELARNYWDEMGQGHAGGMHGPMLETLAVALNLETSYNDVVVESLALGNMMIAFAMNRRYAYQSIGALGVIELTAPGRADCVNRGLKRLGVSGQVRRYFALHATLDVKHSEAWNRDVLRPLIAASPEVAPAIAEGALLRLTAGARCFERYRRELQGNDELGICA